MGSSWNIYGERASSLAVGVTVRADCFFEEIALRAHAGCNTISSGNLICSRPQQLVDSWGFPPVPSRPSNKILNNVD